MIKHFNDINSRSFKARFKYDLIVSITVQVRGFDMNKTLFGIALLGLCICLSIADEPDVPVCPDNDDGEAEFLEDPEDCNAYYECSNGVAFHFACPPGTYYDGNKKCQWPENVDCGTRPTTLEPPTTQSSTDPPSTDIPKPGPVWVQ